MEKGDKRFKIVIAEPISEEGINMLKYDSAFDVISLKKDEKERLKSEIGTADALIVRSGVKATKELIELGNKLKIIGRAGAGYDNIDIDAASKKGIIVLTAPTGNSNGVAELTIALMLALIRFIPKADATMKQGKWEKTSLEGTEVEGKTLGIIGLGKIGTKVAQVAAAMGMHIMVLVKNKNKARQLDFQCEFVENLDALLPKVDFLSLHVPLNSETKGLIGKEQLVKMKPGAYLINTSRGDVVDEQALFEALKEKKIAGAAIDVYSVEPASKEKFPFISLENVIALPHLGASTKESQARTSRMICSNISEALKNEIYIDAVNLPFVISEKEANKYRPFLHLAKRMAQFLAQIGTEKTSLKEIVYTYNIRNIKNLEPLVLTSCAEILKITHPNVSIINIKEKIDDLHRKIQIKESQALQYENSLKIELKYESGLSYNVRGVSLFDIPKIVELQNTAIEFIPAGKAILIRNKNVPGVIGAVAGYLGQNNINISEVNLSKSDFGGEVFQFVGIDSEITNNQISEIRALPNILDAKKFSFE